MAERKAAQGAAPAYMYLLEWETPRGRGKLRSPHALEIPLVFDNVETARNFVGRGDDAADARRADERGVARLRPHRQSRHTRLPDWPAYEAGRRATMVFNLESRVVDDPYPAMRKALG